jgi:voltage-gated potassium channel
VSHMRLVTPRGRRRVDRFTRMTRAVWRDTSALWHEFRRPITVFLAAILIGGWLYGELSALAGYPRLPFLVLTYGILSLMILNPVIDLPSEPYLLLFWYAMPLIAIYVVGRGASDFIRLFFDRAERRSAWEEAVVSTYRNHIIVMGIGHIGLRVLRALADMGIEVVAVDLKRTDHLDQVLAQLRVPLIVGDGRTRTALEQAGLPHARSLIICTSEDFLNLEVCVRARDINPNAKIVVRMWDNEFAAHLKKSLNVETISSSDLAAPAFAGTAMGVDVAPTFNIHDTDYSLLRLEVVLESQLVGKTIGAIQSEHDIDIVLHERGGDVDVHPSGSMSVKVGDNLVIFTRHKQIPAILALNTK